MYRRTTIAAAGIGLALLGGGTALAANAGLFDGDEPGGAGTVPAVSTLDPAPSADVPAAPGQDDDGWSDDDDGDDGSSDDLDGDDGGDDGEVEDDD